MERSLEVTWPHGLTLEPCSGSKDGWLARWRSSTGVKSKGKFPPHSAGLTLLSVKGGPGWSPSPQGVKGPSPDQPACGYLNSSTSPHSWMIGSSWSSSTCCNSVADVPLSSSDIVLPDAAQGTCGGERLGATWIATWPRCRGDRTQASRAGKQEAPPPAPARPGLHAARSQGSALDPAPRHLRSLLLFQP